MLKHFKDLRVIRNNIKEILDKLTLEQVNKIPTGFNNNIIWNVAHVIVTQQLLCYKLSGLKVHIPDEFIGKYKKGASVGEPVNEEELKFIKYWLIESIDRVEADFRNGLFEKNHFKAYSTSFGLDLGNVEDAFRFNNIHEGVHLGYIMAMKKSIH